MRRMTNLLLALLLLLSLTACGSAPAPGSDGPSQPEPPAQAETPEADAPAEPEPEPYTILDPTVQPEGGVDLIAVVQGLVHANDLLHRAKPAQQADGLTLLVEKLLRIGQVLQLAATAAAVMGAGGRISFTHGKHQLIIKLARIFSLSGFFPYYHRFAHLQSGQNVIKYQT